MMRLNLSNITQGRMWRLDLAWYLARRRCVTQAVIRDMLTEVTPRFGTRAAGDQASRAKRVLAELKDMGALQRDERAPGRQYRAVGNRAPSATLAALYQEQNPNAPRRRHAEAKRRAEMATSVANRDAAAFHSQGRLF